MPDDVDVDDEKAAIEAVELEAAEARPDVHADGVISAPEPDPPKQKRHSRLVTMINRNTTSKWSTARLDRDRIVHVNCSRSEYRDEEDSSVFTSNKIRTAKYTVLTFWPINLFEQFRRVANMYFLLVVLIQLFGNVDPVPVWTTLSPLAFILGLSALKDGYEDFIRHGEDERANRAPYEVIVGGKIQTIESKRIEVGQVLRMHSGQEFPADMIILSTVSHDASCHVNTANLDGEVVPRQRLAFRRTSNNLMHHLPAVSRLRGTVTTKPLSKSLDGFEGRFDVEADSEGLWEQATLPLGDENLLLRGSKLTRHCREVYAVVIATGVDTKLMLNRSPTSYKFTSFEHSMNRCVLFAFGFQVFLCTMMALFSAVFDESLEALANRSGATDFGLNLLTLMVLFSFMIPLSLVVTLEFVKVGQAFSMEYDRKLFALGANGEIRRAAVKSSNINEELGQVEVLFTDKTGTLTRNKMELSRIFVDGNFIRNEALPAAASETDAIKCSGSLYGLASAGFYSCSSKPDLVSLQDELISDSWLRSRQFLVNLLVCNTISLSSSADGDDDHENEESLSENENVLASNMFSSSSPDEIAFVSALHLNGVSLIECRSESRTIMIPTRDIHSLPMMKLQFQLLGQLRFSADRSRMSVVAREVASGEVWIYCKGSDAVVLNLVAKESECDRRVYDETVAALKAFAETGSRTLVIAARKLSESDLRAWQKAFEEASVSLDRRERQIEDAFALIEKDMMLLGCTAVDDQLQGGVKEAVTTLIKADIQVIVLTGDKLETAVTIGRSSGIVSPNAELIFVSARNRVLLNQELCGHVKNIDELRERQPDQHVALVISGTTVEVCLRFCEDAFLDVVRRCTTVICSRATPGHKSSFVEVVRRHMNKICCAIGDGANDVPMLMKAHVGVGLTGKEGTQAARAADFVLHRFRHLARLLIVHGRYSYLRSSQCVLQSFYKNMVFPMPLFFFGFYSEFSGQSLYDGLILASFNLLFTSLPPLANGILEKDAPSAALLQYPIEYGRFRDGCKFNLRRFIQWTIGGVVQSIFIYFIAHLIFTGSGVVSSDGRSTGIWTFGAWICTSTILVTNLTFYFLTINKTVATTLACITGPAVYCASLALYSTVLEFSSDLFGLNRFLFGPPLSYMYQFICLIICISPLLVYDRMQRHFAPYFHHLVQEGHAKYSTREAR